MKKIFILLQFILVAAVAVVIGYSMLKQAKPVIVNREAWHSWKGFFVLSYTAVTREHDRQYVDRKQLEDQLTALKHAGYQTVTPEDIADFLSGNSPLPDKAVLLLFEGGRRDSYLYAAPLLREFGMIGTMCIPTALMHSAGSFYLSEDSIKGLSKEAHWRVCSMGNNAINTIKTYEGGSGHFLTCRTSSGGKYEDDASFRSRVSDDYAKAAKILEKASGKPVVLYLYPFADSGTCAGSDPLAAGINRKVVSAHHRIAISSADYPYNGPHDDAYGLNRLRVPAGWTGNMLVRELEKFAPRETLTASLDDDSLWNEYGNTAIRHGSATLSPGSGLWLRGSDAWSDMDVTASFHVNNSSSATIFVRYGGKSSHLRLAVDSKHLIFSEKIQDFSQPLAKANVEMTDRDQKVRLRVKSNRAWIWLNGRPIADSVPLSPAIVSGKMGISSQDGYVELSDLKVTRLPDVYVFAGRFRDLPAATQQEMKGILPLWFSDSAHYESDDQRMNDLLSAASSGVRTIPILELTKDATPAACERAMAALEASLKPPLFRPLVKWVAVRGGGEELPNSLHKKGYGIVRILTPQQAKDLTAGRQKTDNELYLIDGPEKEAREARDSLLHFLPPDRLIVRTNAADAAVPGVGIASNPERRER